MYIVSRVSARNGIEGASVDASYSEGVVTLDLSCEDYGIVIGRRGETLDALQSLTKQVANHVDNSYFKISCCIIIFIHY